MQLSDAYLDLGEDRFAQLIRSISIGKLKTYQIYEGFKVRTHLHKVNAETLRKATPRWWARLSERDEEFAKDLAQAADLTSGCPIFEMGGFVEVRPIRAM